MAVLAGFGLLFLAAILFVWGGVWGSYRVLKNGTFFGKVFLVISLIALYLAANSFITMLLKPL